jgi:flagellar export protein FliJ
MITRNFSLQAVLDLRERAKDQAQDALSIALRSRDSAAARCAEAAERLRELTGMMTGERFPAYQREQYWTALNNQRDLLRALEARLAKEDKIVASKRETLIAADRDLQLVLKLREKWLSNRNAAIARFEEKQMEDFITAQHVLQSAIP